VVTGNLEQARETLALWARTYPREGSPYSFLSGSTNMSLGKYEQAAEAARQSLELDPDNPFGHHNLALNYVFLDRLAEAQITLQRASERKLDIPDLLVLRYRIAFLKADKPEMDRLAAVGRKRPGAEDWICDQEASVLAYSGHLQQARIKSLRAVALARQAGHLERAAQYEAGASVREILFGHAPEAGRSAVAAVDLSKGRDVEYGAALALALAGDSSQSLSLAQDLEKRFPDDTLVRFSYMPVLRALLALSRSSPNQ
jgi:eukaryotic-like serine/threonine-protein kinase